MSKKPIDNKAQDTEPSVSQATNTPNNSISEPDDPEDGTPTPSPFGASVAQGSSTGNSPRGNLK